jgi:hypothetical protein
MTRFFLKPGEKPPETPPKMPIWISHGIPPRKPRPGSERERIIALLEATERGE